MFIPNELIFLFYVGFIIVTTLIALKISKEALIGLIGVEWIFANLFVSKQITIFGLNGTASDALVVGATLGLNLVQEYYGKSVAQKTIWVNFFLLLFYLGISFLHCLYSPSIFDTTQSLFVKLLLPMPRIIFASLITYFVAQTLERVIYGYLKKLEENAQAKSLGEKTQINHLEEKVQDKFNKDFTEKKSFKNKNNYFFAIFENPKIMFILRNYISVSITQFIDTILFAFLGLYGLVANIWQVIIVSYLIKLITLFFATPFLVLSKKIVKNR